jgi:hypothetical protein
MQANTLNEVVQHLDAIIVQCRQNNSRIGYFATLYRAMTLGVQTGIAQGVFDDGVRMEKLDVAFANRYLQAYEQFAAGQIATHSWMHAFNAASQDNLTLVQHLLLGINAHINLDLGIAAAAISTPDTIQALQYDFEQINVVIGNVYAMLQRKLKKISWPVIFLSSLDPQRSDALINFSIQKARDTAWSNALLLSASPDAGDEAIIKATDSVIAKVATCIQNPGGLTNLLVKGIMLFESNDVGKNLDILNEA